MEPPTESRFDPNFAAQVLLEIAHEQSLERLLQNLIDLATERAPHGMCLRLAKPDLPESRLHKEDVTFSSSTYDHA